MMINILLFLCTIVRLEGKTSKRFTVMCLVIIVEIIT